MEPEAAKLIGAGLAAIALAGAGVGADHARGNGPRPIGYRDGGAVGKDGSDVG